MGNLNSKKKEGKEDEKHRRRKHRDPKSPIEDYYELQTSNVLGTGAYSCVYLGKDKETNEPVAIKAVKKIENHTVDLLNESAILLKVNHENIIQFLDMFETADTFYIVMELVNGGELFDRIVEREKYSELTAKTVACQMFQALRYLHQNGIVHRDLKPENILLTDEHDEGPIKITDFGLSKFYTAEMIMKTNCGSPGYTAPEVLKAESSGEGYTAAVDVWSAGVILYILLCGYPPFYSKHLGKLYTKIIAGNYEFQSDFWGHISAEAKDLISKCMLVNPKDRITAKKALKHPWFTKEVEDTAAVVNPLPSEMRANLVTHLSDRRRKTNVT